MEVGTSQVNPEQSSPEKPLYLQLDHETRDGIKLILFNFSSVLNGKELSLKEQKELLERNRRLLLKLSRIPRFYLETQTVPKRDTSRGRRISPRKTRDVLVLGYSTRNEILDILYRNQDYAILFDDHFTEALKKDLVTLNNQLVAKLDDLKNRPSEKQIRRFANFARLTASLTTSSEGALLNSLLISIILISIGNAKHWSTLEFSCQSYQILDRV